MATTQENLDAILTVLNEGHKESFDVEIVEERNGEKTIKSFGRKLDRPDLMSPISILLKIPIYKKGILINQGELILILEYLIKGGYIQRHDLIYIGNSGYIDLHSITYLGKVLIESGGFVRQHSDEQEKKIFESANKAKIESLNSFMANWTMWAAIGAIGIVLFEILKYYFPRPIDAWNWLLTYCNC